MLNDILLLLVSIQKKVYLVFLARTCSLVKEMLWNVPLLLATICENIKVVLKSTKYLFFSALFQLTFITTIDGFIYHSRLNGSSCYSIRFWFLFCSLYEKIGWVVETKLNGRRSQERKECKLNKAYGKLE